MHNYILTASLLLWTFTDALNSIVMLIAYNQLNIHYSRALTQLQQVEPEHTKHQ